jgi:dihydropyrimidinase
MVIDFALQSMGHPMTEAFKTWRAKSEGKACIDYGLHMAVTDLGPNDAWLDDVDAMVAEGISSFKIFMAYPNVLMVDDRTIYKLMERTRQLGALVCVHAENGTVIDAIVQEALAAGNTGPLYHALTRPVEAEAEAVHRVVTLSELAGGARVYIVHVSNEKAMLEVKAARDRGLPVQGETCTQYLVLSLEDDMGKPGFEDAKYVFTPPLREKKNQEPLWNAVKDDVLQVISTDHCPFRFSDQKTLGLGNFTKIPNGGPGVENRMQLAYHHGVNQGRMSLERFVDVTAEAPAKIFGIYPKKGVLAAGSDADIVVWDPNAAYTITAATQNMHTDYSIFEGFQVTGNARQVFSRGELVVEGGKFLGQVGRGRYVHREVPKG